MYNHLEDLNYGGQIKTVRLKRRPGDNFGFALRGGREHNIGFFITQIQPGSESEMQGLMVGDQVIRINNLPVAEAMHKEMLNLIRSKTHVTLKVRSGSLLPFFECKNQALSWKPVGNDHRPLSVSSSWNSTQSSPSIEIERIVLSSDKRGRFGCRICQGPPHKLGIFIQSTEEGSVAKMSGLKPGDQILHCNGRDFSTIDFFEAVKLVKEAFSLNLIIGKGVGIDFISPGESSGYNSAASSVNGDQSPLQNEKKRLSVVREETIDVIDERRGMIVGSVTVDCRKPWVDIENEWEDAEQEQRYTKDPQWIDHSVAEEEKKLKEERRRIEEAQRKLKQEADRLAEERAQLEEARRKLLSETFSSSNKVNEMHHSIKSESCSSLIKQNDRSNKTFFDPIRYQHEQLMEEFKEAHKKMFSALPNEYQNTDVNHESPENFHGPDLSRIHKETIQVSVGAEHCNPKAHIALKSCHSAPPPPPPPLPVPDIEQNSFRSVFPVVPATDYHSTTPITEAGKVQKPVACASLLLKMADTNKTEDTGILSDNAVSSSNKQRSGVPVVASNTGSAVRISIGAYPSQQQRPQPGKFDFLPVKRGQLMTAGDGGNVKSQLQTELSQTLSRARLRQRLPDSVITDEESRKEMQHAENAHPSELPHLTKSQTVEKLNMQENKNSVLMELRARNLNKEQDQNKVLDKMASAGKSSTVAVRKAEPIGILPANKASTVRLSKNNGGPHSTTVVISHCLEPEQIIIQKANNFAPVKDSNNRANMTENRNVLSMNSRKPSPAIQERMAALTVSPMIDSAASGEDHVNSLANEERGKQQENAKKDISQSSVDNKVTIRVGVYESNHSTSVNGILKSGSGSKNNVGKNITFGKT